MTTPIIEPTHRRAIFTAIGIVFAFWYLIATQMLFVLDYAEAHSWPPYSLLGLFIIIPITALGVYWACLPLGSRESCFNLLPWYSTTNRLEFRDMTLEAAAAILGNCNTRIRLKCADNPPGSEVGQSSTPCLVTPATEEGVRALFEGLCAFHETLTFSAPASAAIAITPSVQNLIARFCKDDPRFGTVMANVWMQDYQTMKQQSR